MFTKSAAGAVSKTHYRDTVLLKTTYLLVEFFETVPVPDTDQCYLSIQAFLVQNFLHILKHIKIDRYTKNDINREGAQEVRDGVLF